MGFCVYHFEKGKSQASAIGNHIDRKKGKEHSFKNSDASKRHLNEFYKCNGHDKPLQEAITNRIKEGYKGKKAIRRDAVKYVKHILTGSHEEMKEIFENKELSKKWIDANYSFMIQEFGKENIVRFVLHRDEKTPHLHCVTVPLTEDGKLSAKIVTGNKKSLQKRQDRYAEKMKQFGLERGIKGSRATHTTVTDFYKKVNQEDKIKMELPVLELEELPKIEKPSKSEMIFNIDDWAERQNLKLTRWKEQANAELKKKTIELGQKAMEEIKTKRFKDVSFTFAMKAKRERQTLLETLKKETISNVTNSEKLQETIRDLEFQKEIAKDEGRRQVITEVNRSLKSQKVKLSINNGEVKFTEIKEKKTVKKNQMRR